jgi:hypothetical protein
MRFWFGDDADGMDAVTGQAAADGSGSAQCLIGGWKCCITGNALRHNHDPRLATASGASTLLRRRMNATAPLFWQILQKLTAGLKAIFS